jgi:hypothetical protein
MSLRLLMFGVSVYLVPIARESRCTVVTIKNCMGESLFVANAAFNLIPYKDSVS